MVVFALSLAALLWLFTRWHQSLADPPPWAQMAMGWLALVLAAVIAYSSVVVDTPLEL
ncbi:MAG: hypothetical protein K2X31_03990 [Sphingopyxis sp.]|nr:hypothetical protein [Sphingopyxis sp.]